MSSRAADEPPRQPRQEGQNPLAAATAAAPASDSRRNGAAGVRVCPCGEDGCPMTRCKASGQKCRGPQRPGPRRSRARPRTGHYLARRRRRAKRRPRAQATCDGCCRARDGSSGQSKPRFLPRPTVGVTGRFIAPHSEGATPDHPVLRPAPHKPAANRPAAAASGAATAPDEEPPR